MRVLTSTSMKIAEAIAVEKGSSYLELMENAGRAAAECIRQSLGNVHGKEIVVICGKGNNGGDGLVIARMMLGWGADVTVAFPLGMDEERMTPLCRANLYALREADNGQLLVVDGSMDDVLLRNVIRLADAVVDAVFGTGFSGRLPETVSRIFDLVHKRSVKFALDIPSGINCDTGEADPGSFPADVTYAFAAPKPAHVLKRSARLCGTVAVLDIGIREQDIDSLPEGIAMLTRETAAAVLPHRQPDSHKGSYGKLLNIGGCSHMTGAVMLSTLSALSGGVGLCKVAAPDTVVNIIAGNILPCIHAPMPVSESGSISKAAIPALKDELKWATALLMGCGMSVCEDTKALTEAVLASSSVPMVLDADAINCLAGRADLLKKAKAPVILTPHLLEMSRLCGEPVEVCRDRRFDIASSFAREYGVTLVLKDSTTVIASADGGLHMLSAEPVRDGYTAVFKGSDTSGLAKGGSGDLLAGLIASMLAQGLDPADAAMLGVWLHSRAGDLCEEEMTAYCMQPTDVLRYLPAAFKELL